MSLDFATGLDVGDKKRNNGRINEDSVAVNVLEDGHIDQYRSAGVFVLADGAGGKQAGEIASYIATVEVTRRLTEILWDCRRLHASNINGEQPASGTIEESISQAGTKTDPNWVMNRIETAIQSTHTRIIQQIQGFGLDSAYTTIVAGVKLDNRLYYGWVGDSRIYLVNCNPDRDRERQMSRLTRDHSIVQQLLDRDEIDETEAHVHPKSHLITRALGGGANENPATSSVRVESNYVHLFGDDIVLFTSDGLIDAFDDPNLHDQYHSADSKADIEAEILENAVTDDEIRDIILDADSLSEAVDRYISFANRRGGKDNLSLILFRDPDLQSSPVIGFPDRSYTRKDDSIGSRGTKIKDR